jgi:hypothetical protein
MSYLEVGGKEVVSSDLEGNMRCVGASLQFRGRTKYQDELLKRSN